MLLTSEVLAAAAAVALESRLGPVEVTVREQLGGSERSTVVRAIARDVDGRRHRVVLKAPTAEGEGPVREEAALRLAADHALPGVVRLLGTSLDPPLLVLADAGAGPTVADRLLSADADAAELAVVAWARAVGGLQASSTGLRDEFAAALSTCSPLGAPAVDSSRDLLLGAAATLERALPRLGVEPPRRAFTELREVADALDVVAAGGPGGLVPGDTCPDNAVEADGDLVLLDFEGATFRHLAWEAAYLTVPWPSCWCSWRMPPSVVHAALRAWRDAVTPAVPAVRSPGFADDLARSTVAWAFISASWFIDAALDGDPRPHDLTRWALVPTRRRLLNHRLRLAAQLDTEVLPALRSLAAQTEAETVRAWGPQELPLAPAFQ